MEYRVENKYLVTDADMVVIRHRLNSVMQTDEHQTDDCYEIRSVYFDDLFDSCIQDNESGIDVRKKYRIRTYDTVGSPIKLEIKEKTHGLTKKTSCNISKEEWESISKGDKELQFGAKAPMNELILQGKVSRMSPKVLIAYERSAFVYRTGNVRVTFDRNIMASKEVYDLLSEKVDGLVPVLPKGMHILEVKYDELLPDIIAKQLEIGKLRKTSFSKYYLGRMAVNGRWVY